MDNKTICSQCGHEISIPNGDELAYCPYCSAPLDEPPDNAEKFRLEVETLYKDIKLGLQEYRQRLNDIYTDLGTTKNIYRIITADSIISRDESHRLYRTAATAQLERARKLIESVPADEESAALARRFAGEVTRFFLHAKSRFTGAGKWTLIACEHETEQLMGYIDDAELGEIYKMYVDETPKNEMLPNQRRLMKSMQKRMKEHS